MKYFLLLMFLFSTTTFFGQRIIKPKIGFTPDISAVAMQRAKQRKEQYAKLAARMEKGLTYEQLSPQEKELYDEGGSPDGITDPWYVGSGGCSWYCGVNELKITASSSLAPQGTNTYHPQNASDGTLNSAWVEGAKGNGIGEYIEFTFGKNNPPVTTVILFNGYVKSDKSWKENARIKKLKLSVNGKPNAILELQDSKAEQTFTIGSFQNKTGPLTLRFEILEVYKGLKWEDTVLSELYFDGTGVHCFVGDSPVTMADGTTKNIRDVNTGDEVMSFNFNTQQWEAASVLETASTKHHNLVRYSFGDVSITGTMDHPFYTSKGWASLDPQSSKQYVAEVAPLVKGDAVLSFQNGMMIHKNMTAVEKLNVCEQTFTIVRLSRNKSFLVNGMLVSIEDLLPQP